MSAGAQGAEDRRRLLVIHNPVAGRRRRKRFQAVLDLLERDGAALLLRATQGPGDATRIAREIRDGEADLVVAAGGDGTINEVVNGLVARGLEMEGRLGTLPLAIVPLGTSNVLAAEIGLGRSPEAAARAIGEGPAVRISLGRISDAETPEGSASEAREAPPTSSPPKPTRPPPPAKAKAPFASASAGSPMPRPRRGAPSSSWPGPGSTPTRWPG